VARGRECYHCKQWIEEGTPHDCWTTTEAALTEHLSEDLREAWERLREAAIAFGEQRVYASLNSIMFSRKACYFFVRPKQKFLEICIFLPRKVNAPQVRRALPASKTKTAHLIRVQHRDEVEAPITDWMREAYEFGGMTQKAAQPVKTANATARRTIRTAAKKKPSRKAAKKR
jgi:hypothetical protein